jgi:hypothetical protein
MRRPAANPQDGGDRQQRPRHRRDRDRRELVAELIHRNSPRRGGPFVCINCPAIPDSLLESELFGFERGAFTGAASAYDGTLRLAHGGTLFLDEIGDMSLSAQAKILRVVEAKEVHRLGGAHLVPLDVRIVAATNHGLEALVAQERFRRDLYFRLDVTSIHIPPLRERTQDIPALLQHYIGVLNQRRGTRISGFGRETLESLLRYDWPGNVRELRNLVESVALDAAAGVIERRDLPEAMCRRLDARAESAPLPPGLARERDRDRLLSALLSTNWNKSRAAQELRWARMTVYRKMAKYHIRGAADGGPVAVQAFQTWRVEVAVAVQGGAETRGAGGCLGHVVDDIATQLPERGRDREHCSANRLPAALCVPKLPLCQSTAGGMARSAALFVGSTRGTSMNIDSAGARATKSRYVAVLALRAPDDALTPTSIRRRG